MASVKYGNVYQDFFKIIANSPAPAQSTAYLKIPCLVVKKRTESAQGFYTINSSEEIAPYTQNINGYAFYNENQSQTVKLAVLDGQDLTNLNDVLQGHTNEFFTLIISSDYTDDDIANMSVINNYKGVIGAYIQDFTNATAFASLEGQVATQDPDETNKENATYNLCQAFAKLINGVYFKSQQASRLQYGTSIGNASDNYFNARLTYAVSDLQAGNILEGFFAGGKSITQPYIIEYLKNILQSYWLQLLSVNQFSRNIINAKKIESSIQNNVLDKLLLTNDNPNGYFTSADVNVELGLESFINQVIIDIPQIEDLWRLQGVINENVGG